MIYYNDLKQLIAVASFGHFSGDLSITGAVSGAVLYFGAMLTCQLTSKIPVNYSWTELTSGTSSVGHQLTIWNDGSYNCTASFDISGKWQSVSTTVYNLTVEIKSRLIHWKSYTRHYNSVFL